MQMLNNLIMQSLNQFIKSRRTKNVINIATEVHVHNAYDVENSIKGTP